MLFVYTELMNKQQLNKGKSMKENNVRELTVNSVFFYFMNPISPHVPGQRTRAYFNVFKFHDHTGNT